MPRVNTHKFVRETYFNSHNNVEHRIGKELNDLWLHRKDADYENGAAFDVKRAINAYQLASRILNKLAVIGAI